MGCRGTHTCPGSRRMSLVGRTEGEEVSARCNRLRVGGREGDGSAEASVGPPHVSLPTRCGAGGRPRKADGVGGGENLGHRVPCRAVPRCAVPCHAIRGSQGAPRRAVLLPSPGPSQPWGGRSRRLLLSPGAPEPQQNPPTRREPPHAVRLINTLIRDALGTPGARWNKASHCNLAGLPVPSSGAGVFFGTPGCALALPAGCCRPAPAPRPPLSQEKQADQSNPSRGQGLLEPNKGLPCPAGGKQFP